MGFPGGSDQKESACKAGDPGSAPELGRSPGERNNYPLQYSCQENPVERGAWWAPDHGFAKREMQTEIIMRYHLTTVRMDIIKNFTNNKCWRGCGEQGILLHY